jgi:hypothetical protein
MVFGVDTTLNLAFLQKLLSEPLEGEAAVAGEESLLLLQTRAPRVSFSSWGARGRGERLKDCLRSQNSIWRWMR